MTANSAVSLFSRSLGCGLPEGRLPLARNVSEFRDITVDQTAQVVGEHCVERGLLAPSRAEHEVARDFPWICATTD